MEIFGIPLFCGIPGFVTGLVASGFWEAFCLVTARVEPTSEQILGMALGGGCTGIVCGVGLVTFMIVKGQL